MAEERKMEFAGNGVIKKCPNCGTQLEAFQARCPACGFAIGGEEKGGSAALKNFLDMYTNEKDNARKLEMIDTFPIPNTIEDTIEFALLASQQVKSYAIRQKETGSAGGEFVGLKDIFAMTVNGATAGKMVTNTDFRIAWQNKLEQICYRAKFAYPQEKEKLAQLDMLIEDVEDASGTSKKRRKREEKKETEQKENVEGKKRKKGIVGKIIIGVIVFYLLVGLLGLILLPIMSKSSEKGVETHRLEKLTTEIQTDIAEGNYDAAELKLLDFKWKHDKDEAQISIWEEKKALLVKQLESKKEGNK